MKMGGIVSYTKLSQETDYESYYFLSVEKKKFWPISLFCYYWARLWTISHISQIIGEKKLDKDENKSFLNEIFLGNRWMILKIPVIWGKRALANFAILI